MTRNTTSQISQVSANLVIGPFPFRFSFYRFTRPSRSWTTFTRKYISREGYLSRSRIICTMAEKSISPSLSAQKDS